MAVAKGQQTPDRVAWLYEAIAEDEDARVCKDIPEEACRYVPANFFILVVSNLLTKIGDALSSPKTVLTWVMTFVQAPTFLIAFLVPIRESGSMLPQLVIASYIRQLPKRRNAWLVGAFLQCVAILAIGAVAYAWSGAAAGWAIVGCLVVFSLSRGICSVSHKDILGKTIPKTRRGRLSGLSATLSGLAVLAVGLYLLWARDGSASPAFYGWLLAGAGLTWLLSVLVFSFLREFPGETEGGGNALAEGLRRLDLLRTDTAFRRFVISRALLLCSALSAPYYVVLGQRSSESELSQLGLFILANGLASSLSASIWGRLADVSSRNVLIAAGAMAATIGTGVFVVDHFVPVLASARWTYPIAFLLLGIAHSGVRLGRKTYVVDMAGGNKRTDYVAVSNTVIGAVLLLTGAVGALSTFLSPSEIVLVLAGFGYAGAVMGFRLPEVE